MKHTFYLDKAKSPKKTLILFSCYFNLEKKKFVYSTGENILPEHWSKETNSPKLKGSNKDKSARIIKDQLNRHSKLFSETVGVYKNIGETLTSAILKEVFNKEFKKGFSNVGDFFSVYDEFVADKTDLKQWSPATIKRYKNIKNMLKDFEQKKKYKLTFSKINNEFHKKLTVYCMDDLNHINNTYARNLGLIKTFLYWSLENKKTMNEEFKKFKKVEKVITNQVALTLEDLQKLLEYNFESKKLERVRDIFVFACVTGMRFGELSSVSKSTVNNDSIILKEEKDETKQVREIPLNSISRIILEKYNYKLPLITNQKQNDYIKEVFKELDYDFQVQKVTTKGKENIKEDMPFYDRVSSHTARRTFITMMKRQGKSDKLIASVTGHRDMKTLNSYYQVSTEEKKEAIEEVFKFKK
ncbi:tyrosine-type recombinase/integrase [Tenacibaculum finnmarkense genomovar finnmarkense]|uniref:tyrosine-type recombinase/integrase n=1 Tax=Tenacibaculum finnmarkense TaxID=2781243 RepID=UPI001E521675|nr:tyrosine-type recombinase/integrase [Tenacibaculum finnmarkense]MCD8417967.1 site-specific integrase [Tenacibaculum finnmarkense genomovar finnmarkense]MCG8186354.1 tyrosine-type recombinase/integrase [Tenacibaculum finnmarkense genomovar finnmarkense]MCG8202915.1 tyrosine-type recombinase/integrase [Tenacibaculum finnmarkense genomovar finnmarkense]MCG8210155.1 tyrosine-type recombinase/integrase [Tenacibaculum finnmarkense genomovar finnmarkense]MCG8213196.1 tyrosine-type recombinase/inte